MARACPAFAGRIIPGGGPALPARSLVQPFAGPVPSMPNVSASIKNAFAIPRRQTPAVASRDLPQWSQWSCERTRRRHTVGQWMESDSSGDACAATLSRVASEAVVAALPKRARERLLELTRSSAVAQWRFLSVVGAALIPGGIVFVALAPLNIVAASWAASGAFYFAHCLAMRTIRRELLVRWFQTQPIDSRFESCPNCRYDQRGSSSDLCSECGCPVRL